MGGPDLWLHDLILNSAYLCSHPQLMKSCELIVRQGNGDHRIIGTGILGKGVDLSQKTDACRHPKAVTDRLGSISIELLPPTFAQTRRKPSKSI
jgi:hypothetical protein